MARARSALDELDEKGSFQRVDSGYRNWVKTGGKHPPEAGRYHLYVSYACPWAHRALIVRKLKGLEDVISLSVVHPTWQRTRPDDAEDTHCGWVFRDPNDPPLSQSGGKGTFGCEDCIPDTVNQAKTVRELYDMMSDKIGKFTVPILWDKQERAIVNNESSEIIQMLNSSFDEFSSRPDLNLMPSNLSTEMENIDSWVYPTINNGVYRCGFAQTQEAYDEAVSELFGSLDRMEQILSENRYLCGSSLTMTDIRAFVTLVRFDEVYVVYFKTNKKRIADYPNILNYVREIYQMPGIAETVNMSHIKTHYFTSHPTLNFYAIIPAGPGTIGELQEPHDRSRFQG